MVIVYKTVKITTSDTENVFLVCYLRTGQFSLGFDIVAVYILALELSFKLFQRGIIKKLVSDNFLKRNIKVSILPVQIFVSPHTKLNLYRQKQKKNSKKRTMGTTRKCFRGGAKPPSYPIEMLHNEGHRSTLILYLYRNILLLYCVRLQLISVPAAVTSSCAEMTRTVIYYFFRNKFKTVLDFSRTKTFFERLASVNQFERYTYHRI